jgi:septal ring factor EnvC (AmiA/AmiB activator)
VNRIPYYRCTRTMHFNNAVCSVKHINADHLESLAVGKLSVLSQNDAYLRISVAEMNGDLKRKVGPLQKEAEQVRSRLKEIDQEIWRYVKALSQGKLSIGRLETEIATLEFDRDASKRRQMKSSVTPSEQTDALQCVLTKE